MDQTGFDVTRKQNATNIQSVPGTVSSKQDKIIPNAQIIHYLSQKKSANPYKESSDDVFDEDNRPESSYKHKITSELVTTQPDDPKTERQLL